jgi:hypothetical protein
MSDEQKEDQQVITMQEASDATGIPRRSLYNAAQSGALKTIRPGPPWLTTLKYVRDWEKNRYIPRPRDVKKP